MSKSNHCVRWLSHGLRRALRNFDDTLVPSQAALMWVSEGNFRGDDLIIDSLELSIPEGSDVVDFSK
jgi:hypothetical protein